MKNPPTLSDAIIAKAAKRKMYGSFTEQHVAIARHIAAARKFVLDDKMAAFFAEMTHVFWRGGQRKRMAALENCRRLARLPHAITWIELPFGPFHKRMTELGAKFDVQTHDDNERIGWLFRQHPNLETVFRATEAWTPLADETSKRKRRPMVHPISIAWSSDETIPPWPFKRPRGYGDSEAEIITETLNYKCPQVRWVYTFDNERENARLLDGVDVVLHPIMGPREFWPLLATLNDLPVKIEIVEPRKGFVTKGSYKHFVTHSVIHLTVPETRWYKLTKKLATALHRRAHQVRGHWRIDWRNRPGRTCEHKWTPMMTCDRCGGHYLWIAEHIRGDASLGFVVHDYDVTHGKPKAAA